MKTLRLLLLVCAAALLGRPAVAQTVNLTVTDGNISETLAGQTANPGNLRITRTGATTSALTVWVKIGGTALQNTDYRFASTIGTSVIIPVGSAFRDLPITPVDDWLTEGTEVLRFELDDETASGTNVPYAIGNTDKVDLNILDNEDPLLPPRAIVSVAAIFPQISEASPAAFPAAFRITRTNNLNVALNVLYSLGGTATAGTDYTLPPATISIPSGSASADVPIAPIDDPLVETPETITFTVVPHPSATAVPPPPEAYVLGTAVTAGVTLISEDVPPPPSVTITSPANGSSQTSPATVPLSIPITFTASDVDGHIVSYTIYDGTRVVVTANATYPTTPAPGTPLTVNHTMANIHGGAHPLRVRVTDNSGVTSYSPIVTTTVTYTYPIMSVTALDADGAEVEASGTQNPAMFVVQTDAPMAIDQYVVYRLTSPGPGVDFFPPAGYSFHNWPMYIFSGPSDYGYARFPAGTTRVEIPVAIVDDFFMEGTETLTLTLHYPMVIDEQTFEGIVQFTEGGFYNDPNAIPVRNFQYDIAAVATATATIADNDTQPAPFSIVNVTLTDSHAQETAPGIPADPAVLTITRDGPTTLPLNVRYSVGAGPRPTVITSVVAVALNGVDFTTLTGTAIIPAGASSVDVLVAPIYDLIAEPSEGLQIRLEPSLIALPSPLSYMLGTNTVVGVSILDAVRSATTSVVRIRTTDSQAYEAAVATRLGAFVVERTGSLTNAVTVAYSISGTATNGVDYSALPGSVTIPAGSASAPIIVNPIDDPYNEGSETVVLTLLPPPPALDPPPYVLALTSTAQFSAGVGIHDVYTTPLNRYQRALQIRGRSIIITRTPADTVTPPAGTPPPPPTQWRVEASTDLASWEQIGTVQSNEETDDFVDVNAGDYPQRFYRFVPVPVPVP